MSGNPATLFTLFDDPERVEAVKLRNVTIPETSFDLEATRRNLNVTYLRESLVCSKGCQRIAVPMSGYVCPNGHVYCWHCAKCLFEKHMGICTTSIGTVIPKMVSSQNSWGITSSCSEKNVVELRGRNANVGGTFQPNVKQESGTLPAKPASLLIEKEPKMSYVKCNLGLQRRTDPASMALFLRCTWKCPRGCSKEILGHDYNQHLSEKCIIQPNQESRTQAEKRKADEIKTTMKAEDFQ